MGPGDISQALVATTPSLGGKTCRMLLDARALSFLDRVHQDWQRAEQILREGLAVDQVRDRVDMLGRLAEVCEQQGRKGEATELRKEAKRSVAATKVTRQKIGRNEPCTCGSGKKFKKCCGP